MSQSLISVSAKHKISIGDSLSLSYQYNINKNEETSQNLEILHEICTNIKMVFAKFLLLKRDYRQFGISGLNLIHDNNVRT